MHGSPHPSVLWHEDSARHDIDGYKDPLGGASKVLKSLKAGAKVTWIKDDGQGWSQVKRGVTKGWVMNSTLSKSGLSKFPVYTLGAKKKAIKVVKGKKSGTTDLAKGTKYKRICIILSGKYANKKYIAVGSARYYI